MLLRRKFGQIGGTADEGTYCNCVLGQGDILGNLCPPGRRKRRELVLGTINHPGLHRRVNFGEGNDGSGRTQRIPPVKEHFDFCGAHLQSLEILHRSDRGLRGDHVALGSAQVAKHLDTGRGFVFLCHPRADLAACHLHHVFFACEDVGNFQQTETLGIFSHHAGCADGEVDRARLNPIEQFGIGAETTIVKHLNFDCSAGLLCDTFGELDCGLAVRMSGRCRNSEL